MSAAALLLVTAFMFIGVIELLFGIRVKLDDFHSLTLILWRGFRTASSSVRVVLRQENCEPSAAAALTYLSTLVFKDCTLSRDLHLNGTVLQVGS